MKLEKQSTFRFRYFTITQDKNVHKVGTDGVLLGAWVDIKASKTILDIGTGTGLIALMLAQRSLPETFITAIEPDLHSFNLARQNVSQSSFHEKIKILNIAVQDFNSIKYFDLIVCNPPFFNNSMKPPNEKRKLQRHSESLPFQDLISATNKLLTPSGRLVLIIPVAEGNHFIKLAASAGLYLSKQCAVFSKESKPQERWLLEFSMVSNLRFDQTNLTIMNDKGEWAEEYKALTKDFYLDF